MRKKFKTHLYVISFLLILFIQCGDRRNIPFPGQSDSLHYFNPSDYSFVKEFSDSGSIKLVDSKFSKDFRKRLQLQIVVRDSAKGLNYQILYIVKNNGRTIKPSAVQVDKSDVNPDCRKVYLSYDIFSNFDDKCMIYLKSPTKNNELIKIY